MIRGRKALSIAIIAVLAASALFIPVHLSTYSNAATFTGSQISTPNPVSSSSSPTLVGQSSILSVTFNEGGLPSGTIWNVSIAGHVYSSRNSSMTISIPAGTYNYTVSNSLKYFTESPNGTLNLKSNGQEVSTYYPGKYTVSNYLNLENGKIVNSLSNLSSSQSVFPVNVIFDNYQQLFLVAGYSSSTIYELNPQNYSIYGQISVPGTPLALALNTFNGNIYAINDTSVLKLSPTGELLDSSVLPSTPSTMAFDPANGQVLVASTNGGVIAFNGSDLSQVAVLSSVSVFDIQGFAYNSATSQMEMLDDSGLNSYVYFMNTNDTVAKSVQVPGIVLSLVYDAQFNVSLFSTSIINSGSGNVQYAYILSGSNLTRISGSANAFGLGIDSRTGMGIATNTQNSTIMLLNLSTASVVYTLYTGGSPLMPATVPGSSGMLVIDPSLDAVDIIPLGYSVMPVHFVETGISNPVSWGASVNGYTLTTDSNNLLFYETVGNYTYYPVPVSGYANEPASYFGVSTGNNTVFVHYNKTFMVRFIENGLLMGKQWGVTFSGVSNSASSGTPISFNMPNGTYNFEVASTEGYAVSPENGTLKIAGSNVSVNVSFSPKSYLVNFTVSGLPGTSTWDITINGIGHTVQGDRYSYVVTPGNYTYSIQPITGYYPVIGSGSFTVNDSNISINVQWEPFLYKAEFTQNMLPNGTEWYVNMSNGISLSSFGSNVSSYLQNGSYSYTFTSSNTTWKGFHGDFTVQGKSLSTPLNFTEILYGVTFSEKGLPSGTDWTVVLNSTTVGSTQQNISFQLPNGTYLYTASSVNTSYQVLEGSLEVHGGSVLVNLSFNLKTANVTFHEKGLPKGTQWGVNILQRGDYNATAANLTISLPLGTYSYIPVEIPGFNSTNISNTFLLGPSGDIAINISYSSSKTTTQLYNITAMEVGLPRGLDWSVTYNSTVIPAFPEGVFNFQLPNGTYNFTFMAINHAGKEMPGSLSVTLHVNGTAQDLLVVFYGTNVWVVLDFPLLGNGHEINHHHNENHRDNDNVITSEAIRVNLKFY